MIFRHCLHTHGSNHNRIRYRRQIENVTQHDNLYGNDTRASHRLIGGAWRAWIGRSFARVFEHGRGVDRGARPAPPNDHNGSPADLKETEICPVCPVRPVRPPILEQPHERTVNELIVRVAQAREGQRTATPNWAVRSELSRGSEFYYYTHES